MDVIRRHRRAVSTALALLLALESVAAVSAAAGVALAPSSSAHALPPDAPAGTVLAEAGTAGRDWEPAAAPAAPIATVAPASTPDAPDYAHPRAAVTPAPVVKSAAASPSANGAGAATPAAKPGAQPSPKPTAKAASRQPAAFVGRNHVWIPSLGVNQSVAFFSCTRSAPPDNYVYRWGCAGSNNVYLLGHAYSVFQPLHDAYVNGRLSVGMKVFYADGTGQTRVYAVSWWRLTRPTTDASWAWAPQPTPSMTLQTCVGANSEYRLMVRLVQVG